jgi:hypothetical protein
MKTFAMITLGLVLAGSVLATDLEIIVETDKPVYSFGEDVNVLVTAFNPTDSAITLFFSNSCQASYLVDGWYHYEQGCWTVPSSVTIGPNDFHTWTMIHDDWQRYTCPLRPGRHNVVGRVYGYTKPVEFEVIGELPEIYVATDGNDQTGDGTSENPFRTIQKGIDTAVPGSDVIVLPGTYTGSGNRDISFDGKGLTLRSQTGPQDCIIDCNGSAAEPHRGFGFSWLGGLYSVVDGFTITDGYADRGGAICCEYCGPKIANCIISNNVAQEGAGIFIHQSSPVVTGCTFRTNSAHEGAAAANSESSPTFSNCIFTDNLASGAGGAIYNSLSNPTLSSCIFRTNSAYSGAAVANDQSSPTVTNCIFTVNAASGRGGGMHNASDSHPQIVNCTFAANSGTTRGSGLVSTRNSSAGVVSCIFWNNQPVQIWGTAAVTYSNIQGGWEGDGNIDTDPCFADPCNGDYHLKSQAGRWDPNSLSWVFDGVTSACIDAGRPGLDFGAEPYPNGGRINMGTYGSTAHASKSPWITCWEAAECPGQPFGDASCDAAIGLADLFALKAHFGNGAPWADNQCCVDFNHDNAVNLADLFILRTNYGSLDHSPSTLNQACPP